MTQKLAFVLVLIFESRSIYFKILYKALILITYDIYLNLTKFLFFISMSTTPVNSKSTNPSLLFTSLPDYIDKLKKMDEDKAKVKARVMSLALPIFHIKAAVRLGFATLIRLPFLAVKIPVGVILFFSPSDSLAAALSFKVYRLLPSFVDMFKSAAKVCFCVTAIVWSPFVGLFSPRANANLHRLAGLSAAAPKKVAPPATPPPRPDSAAGFEGIVGMETVKDQMQSIMMTLKNRDLAQQFKVGIPNGILLEGPPGCGKSFFVEKFAQEVEKQVGKKVLLSSITASSPTFLVT